MIMMIIIVILFIIDNETNNIDNKNKVFNSNRNNKKAVEIIWKNQVP